MAYIITKQSKIYMKIILPILLFTFLTVSCSNKNEMLCVDVDAAMMTGMSTKLSEVVKTLDYVALETDTKSLIGDKFEVALFEKDIAIISKRKIQLFDRSTGKFKQEVLHWGREPQAYASTMIGNGMVANEKKGYIFIKEWNKNISAYHVYTKERNQIPVGSTKSIAYVNDSSFVTTAFNFDGKQKVKMRFYESTQYVDSIPNHWFFELKSDAMAVIDNDEIFYRFDNRTFFKDATNDTVFAVTDYLNPTIVFKSSNMPQIELREHPEIMAQKMKGMYFINNIMEDKDYIYYTVANQKKIYNLLYDKKSGEGGVLKGGLINDIDGKINLFPDHITDCGEYVFILNPATMSEEDLVVCKLKADDNPMIVIGK